MLHPVLVLAVVVVLLVRCSAMNVGRGSDKEHITCTSDTRKAAVLLVDTHCALAQRSAPLHRRLVLRLLPPQEKVEGDC